MTSFMEFVMLAHTIVLQSGQRPNGSRTLSATLNYRPTEGREKQEVVNLPDILVYKVTWPMHHNTDHYWLFYFWITSGNIQRQCHSERKVDGWLQLSMIHKNKNNIRKTKSNLKVWQSHLQAISSEHRGVARHGLRMGFWGYESAADTRSTVILLKFLSEHNNFTSWGELHLALS